ncbi:MAG: hypothetical protein JWO36_3708 [Myxococcales bacterium]|nr:hypothetical protein [Myxococcales bacterium]
MRREVARLVGLIALAIALLPAAPARAEEPIAQLTTMLSSSSDKTRLSAVVSLARLGDKRALKPLVTALHDPNAQIRGVAAAALGRLGHRAALPALRSAATDDADATVRARAREATVAVAKANHVPDELPAIEPKTQARHGGFGRQPHAVEDQPDLYVVIKSSNDDSPGKTDKPARKVHGDVIRDVLVASFKSSPTVTMIAADAKRWGLDPRLLDLSVVKLDVTQNGGYIEVNAELRLAISDENGKMLSFVSGGAKVQMPQAKFNWKYLPNVRKEALENAMRGLFDKLLEHLRQTSQS